MFTAAPKVTTLCVCVLHFVLFLLSVNEVSFLDPQALWQLPMINSLVLLNQLKNCFYFRKSV